MITVVVPTDILVRVQRAELTHVAPQHALMFNSALPSWHPKADVSTVVPSLAGPVTSFQHSVIVSEQGTAHIWGHDTDEQAQQIIDNVAHAELRDAGRLLGFALR